jgi:hypothetical protein
MNDSLDLWQSRFGIDGLNRELTRTAQMPHFHLWNPAISKLVLGNFPSGSGVHHYTLIGRFIRVPQHDARDVTGAIEEQNVDVGSKFVRREQEVGPQSLGK